MSTHLLAGMHYFFEGFKLILKPKLKRFVILPLLLNFILFSGIFWLSEHYFMAFSSWLGSYLPHWLHWLQSLLWLLFILTFFLVVIYSFVTVANLVGAPFNSLLAAEVEEYLTGKKQQNDTLMKTIKDLPRLFGRQLSILAYYLPRALILFVLLFIPVIQLIAAPLFFIFSAWFITLQMIDYPSDNHRIPWATIRTELKQKKLLGLSFGATVLVFSMIPIVNFFVIPAAVAGATKLWLEAFQIKGTYHAQ